MRFWLCNLTLIVVLLITSGASSPLIAASAAAAQPYGSPEDLCALMPPEAVIPGVTVVRYPQAEYSGQEAYCILEEYFTRPGVKDQIAVTTLGQWPDEATAKANFEDIKSHDPRYQVSGQYGDAGVYYLIPPSDPAKEGDQTIIGVTFVYGCYSVQVFADIPQADTELITLLSKTYPAALNQTLKARPRCPVNAPVPPQSTGNLCNGLLPEPFSGLAEPWRDIASATDSCTASQTLNGDGGHQAWANFLVLLHSDTASATATLETMKSTSLVASDKFQPSKRYGDAGWYGLEQADSKDFINVDIAFVYGCYWVDVNATIDPASHISPDFASTTYAGYVAQALKGRPRCPGTTPPQAPPTKHTVGLGCAIGNAPNTMRCAASVYDTLPGANIVYKWAVNGKEQAGVTGAGLTVENLAPGDYTVNVTAIDQAHGNAASQPASFVMTVAGGPAPAESGVFKVRLKCTISELPDRSRRVDCTATAENPPAGANLKYVWNWNGVPDYMQTGTTFEYGGTSSGTNTISVNVIDMAGGSRSESASTTVDIPRLDGSPADGSDVVPTMKEMQPEVHSIVNGLSPDEGLKGNGMLNEFFSKAPAGHTQKTDPGVATVYAYAIALSMAKNPENGLPLYPSVFLAMSRLEDLLRQVMLGAIPLSTVEQELGLLVVQDKALR